MLTDKNVRYVSVRIGQIGPILGDFVKLKSLVITNKRRSTDLITSYQLSRF